MFKALPKGQAPDGRGTLAALWGKASGRKEGEGGSAAPLAAPDEQQAGSGAPPEQTPAAHARQEGGEQQGAGQPQGGQQLAAAAPPLPPPGDVAISAAPEPSPEPAAALAAAAAARRAEAEAKKSAGAATGGKDAAPAPAPAAAPAPAPAAATPAVGSAGGDKKRKRGPAAMDAGGTESQVAALQELFAENEYAKTEQKAALAARIGLEAAQVNKWFEKQRKKLREETGTAPKRGRPKSGGGSSGATAASSSRAAVAPAEGGQAAAEEPAAVQPPAPAVDEGQLDEEMDVDVQGDVGAEAGQQEGAPAALAAAVPAADDMATPAAAAKPAAAPAEGPALEPAGAAAAAAAASGASPAAAGGVAAKTPASAPAPRAVSAEEKAALVAELEAEAAVLHAGGLAPALRALPSEGAGPSERLPLNDGRLAVHVAGQRVPLSQLVSALLPLFREPDSQAPVPESVLRSRIIDLATRKCHGPKEGPKDGGSSLVDALEDNAAAQLWQWELRDQKHLPKEDRPAAQSAKKRASRVQERLGALSATLRLLREHGGGKAAPKLCKALDALQKAKTLAEIEAEHQAEREAAAAKAAAKKLASASKSGAGVSAEEKARQKAEKEAAKEAEKAEKAAEKERLKAEKEAEKERAKAEREAEKEKQRAEKEAERERKAKEAENKAAKKTGYKDADALKKSANRFMSFFQPKPGATPARSAAACGSSDTSPGGPAVSQQTSQLGAPSGSQQQQQQQSSQQPTAKKERTHAELYRRPEGPPYEAPPSAAQAMDAAAGQLFTVQQAHADWQQLLRAMKHRRREAAAQPRPVGLPPSWARKSNAVELAQARLDMLRESGADMSAIRTWRRKLIWFDGDSQRPPFYGSCAPSPAVRPRRYLARDEALDYEVMSDLDWEEEPKDASSLSDADDESEMAEEEQDEEHDSFICADGYLSEDEGVQMEDVEDVDGEAPEGLPEGAAAAAGIDPQRLLSMQQLEAQMERARRAGKPLIISRLPGASNGAGQGAFLQGDVSLLGALAAEVLLPGVRVGVPEDLAADAPAGGVPASAAKDATAAGPASGANPSGRPSVGRPRAPRPEDLLPDLLRMVQADPRQNKGKITEQFLAAHPARKIPKKWVADALKDNADWKGTTSGWVLKPAALMLLATASSEAAGLAAPPAAAGAGVAAAAGAGVEPTPAATKAAPAAGGIDRFFSKGPATTPAVPSALRPDAPPSEFKAPDRLVTTTAAGASAAPPSPLVLPEEVSGTADPFWRQLLQRIESADGAAAPTAAGAAQAGQPAGASGQEAGQLAFEFEAAFRPEALARLAAGMPASVLTALVTGVAAPSTEPSCRAAYLRCLESAVRALAAVEAEAAADSLSASQQVWAPRGAPLAASLAELCREPQLLPCLAASVEAGQAAGAGAAQVGAARSAADVAAALLACPGLQAALAAAGLEGSTDGAKHAEEQLQELARAGRQLGGGATPMET